MTHTIVFHIIKLAKKVRRAIEAKLDIPFSYSQSSALLTIESRKGISQREIAQILHLEPASVVSLIDELEKLKLANRKPTADRRRYEIVLTENGHKAVKKIKEQAQKLENYLVEKLPKKDSENFLKTIEQLSGYLDKWEDEQINFRKEVNNESTSSKRPLAV